MKTMCSTRSLVVHALLVLAAVSAMAAASVARAAFLEPEQAFEFNSRVIDAKTIEVKYRIADGYYLYRERFKFAVDPATSGKATLGEPVLPKGEIKFDETFQKDVEHYRKEVAVRIPVEGATGPITLLSTSQGCADAGLCYPPQQVRALLKLSAPGSGTSTGAAGSSPDTSTASNASTALSTPPPTPSATASSNGSRVASSTASSSRRSAETPSLDDSSRIARTLMGGNQIGRAHV